MGLVARHAGLLVRAALAVLGFGSAWLTVAPNRLQPGVGLSAGEALGSVAYASLAALIVAVWRAARPSRRGRALALAVLIGTLALLLWTTGHAASVALAGRPPAARAGLGAGFWITNGGLIALCAGVARGLGIPRANLMLAAWSSVLVMALGGAGALDALSLVREFRARSDVLGAALGQHAVLAAETLALALAIAVPLGWLGFRRPRVDAVTSAALQAVQVVPAIALLAGLVSLLALTLNAVPALRRLGLTAIGPLPAVLGIAAYLLLPLTRSVATALRSTDPALVEAARGMGMTEGQIASKLRVPLGAPILLAGLRLGVVQSIGLVTLGGLVGAGGLGAVVFEGMGQFASDLILLGAAPIVAAAVAADVGLRGLGRASPGREAGA